MALLNTWASQQDQATLSPLSRLLNNYIQQGNAPLSYLMRGDPQGLWKNLNTPKPVNTTQDMTDLALNLNPVMGLLGATAFHGSPYLFDKFDPTKVGSGVGQQLFGKGTYFAESPAVAKEYAKINPSGANPSPSRMLLGKDVAFGSPEYKAAQLVDELGVSKAKKFADEWAQNPTPDRVEFSQSVKNALSSVNKKSDVKNLGTSNLYKVDIPDEIIPNMLQWDKPLGEQTTEIQRLAFEYAKPLAKEVKLLQRNKLNQLPENSTIWNTLTGSNLYKLLKNKFKSEDELTGLLQSKGIPGVKYTEEKALRTNPQGVKYMDTTGAGTSNYVLFDPTVVKMLETKKGLLK
jgi:hypothetical protein